MSRVAGVLLHPTSLSGRFGIGDLGPAAVDFLDWLTEAGQSVWQFLPLNPVGVGNSPYGTLSAFAGNPLLISPERLADQELIPRQSLGAGIGGDSIRVDFERVTRWKRDVLRAAFRTFTAAADRESRVRFEEFVDVESAWLDDWAMFAAIRDQYDGRSWNEWSPAVAGRDPRALAEVRERLRGEIDFHRFTQFLFFEQWSDLRKEAARRRIVLMGDIPIYVAYDSADVWSARDQFLLDDEGQPSHVAGVPPDYFSETGQLWGNPLYDWDRMEADGYRWWSARLAMNFRFSDLVRIDHFRAFAAYWAVRFGEETAIGGSWRQGPGRRFFDAMRTALGRLPLVAEDLGLITPDVDELRDAVGLPGMRVMQFAFGEFDGTHAPHRHPRWSVVYTGTHDNDTTRGWWGSIEEWERQRALDYLGSSGRDIVGDMILAAYRSAAELAIIPMQDVLGLGSEARMNTPGEPADNWSWRLGPDQLRASDAGRLRYLAKLTGRIANDEE